MKNNDNIEKLWKDSSDKILSQSQITEEIISSSVKSKSKELLNHLIKEQKTGLWASLLITPVLFYLVFKTNGHGIPFVLIIFLALIISGAWYFNHIFFKKLSATNLNLTLKENLKLKIKLLNRFYFFNKLFTPFLGVFTFLFASASFRMARDYQLNYTRSDIEFMVFGLVFIIIISLGIQFFQHKRYVLPLKNYLRDIEENSTSKNPALHFNLALIISIVILVIIIIFFLIIH